MKKVIFLLIIINSLYSNFILAQQKHGLSLLVEDLDPKLEVGKQYLVFIAIDKYEHWMPLNNSVKDAQDIKNILLSKYYFNEVYELYDQQATKNNIINLFNNLLDNLEVNDSLLIFFTGHGYFDERTNSGYWIPVNGGKDNDEQDNWLSNELIRIFISDIKASHLLLICDSIFSSSLINMTGGHLPEINNDYFKNAYARKSRQVLISGEMKVISDRSEFAQHLKIAIQKNNNPYLDTIILYNEMAWGIMPNIILFGSLKKTGHQPGASFLLFLKQEEDWRDDKNIENKQSITQQEDKINEIISKTYFSYYFSFGALLSFTEVENRKLEPGGILWLYIDYNLMFAWGTLGFGIGCGVLGTPEIDSMDYSRLGILQLAIHIKYKTDFRVPFDLYTEISVGMAFNYENEFMTIPFVYPIGGINIYNFVVLYCGGMIIFFNNSTYFGIVPGIGLNLCL